MRILEILILLSELGLVILLWFQPARLPKVFKSVIMALPGFLLLHVLIEGVRWQMVPAYILIAVLLLSSLILHFGHLHKFFKIVFSLIGIILILSSSLLGYVLPVFSLPQPSGQFAMGTTYLHLRDETRAEMATEDTTDRREIMVRVWYPAEAGEQQLFPYISAELSKVYAESNGFPAFITSHLNLTKTNALEDAPVAEEKESFPIIIFSHGYMTHSSMYTSILETLASHGYVVLSIDYTYEAPVSVFPHGELKFFDSEYTNVWNGASWDSVQASIEAFRTTHDLDIKRQQAKKYLELMPYTPRVDHWADDIQFVIDQLQSKNQLPDQLLFNKLNLDKIGVIGHSVGGAASAVACAYDPRIKAGINLDGSQWGSLMDTVLTQPFLWMTVDKDPDNSVLDLDAFIYENTSKNEFYHLNIAQATHANFSDLSLWANHPSITQTGAIDGHRMITIVNDCTLAFFDKFLKNEPLDVEGLAEHFHEINLVE